MNVLGVQQQYKLRVVVQVSNRSFWGVVITTAAIESGQWSRTVTRATVDKI
jgi:hypothetical protein